ncbi:hypothetical protein Tco_0790155 [Tanacetum coccineum]
MRHHNTFNHNHTTFNLNNHNKQKQSKEPQPPPKETHEPQRRGKQAAKVSITNTVDLEEDEEYLIRTVQHWTREEETLLCECWVEVSENNEIGADQSKDSFWWHITKGGYEGGFVYEVSFGRYIADGSDSLDIMEYFHVFVNRGLVSTKVMGRVVLLYGVFKLNDFRHKIQATESAYEAKKAKELAYMECKEL